VDGGVGTQAGRSTAGQRDVETRTGLGVEVALASTPTLFHQKNNVGDLRRRKCFMLCVSVCQNEAAQPSTALATSSLSLGRRGTRRLSPCCCSAASTRATARAWTLRRRSWTRRRRPGVLFMQLALPGDSHAGRGWRGVGEGEEGGTFQVDWRLSYIGRERQTPDPLLRCRDRPTETPQSESFKFIPAPWPRLQMERCFSTGVLHMSATDAKSIVSPQGHVGRDVSQDRRVSFACLM